MFGEGWSRADAQDFVKRCYDRDALLETLLGFSSSWLDAVLVGLIGKAKVQVQRGAGAWAQLQAQTIESAGLTQRLQLGAPTLGGVEELGLGPLVRAAPGLAPSALLVIPILIAGRPVVALLGCPAPGVVELPMFEEISILSQLVALQLEEIILLAKSGNLPPAAERIPPQPKPRPSSAPAAPTIAAAPNKASAILRPQPAEDDELLGFSSVSEPYPESLQDRQDKATAGLVSVLAAKHALLDAPSTATIDRPSSEGVLDKQKLLALPRSPFDEESSSGQAAPPSEPRRPAPPALMSREPASITQELPAPNPRHDFQRDETSGVSIIQPKDIHDAQDVSKKTLMGGFSVADALRAKQEAQRQEAEQRAKMRQTLNGGFSPMAALVAAPSAPAAQILKPNRRRGQESEAHEEAARQEARQEARPKTPHIAPQGPSQAAPQGAPSACSVEALVAQLDQRDARQVAEALARLLEQPGGAEIIIKRFPGHISVDRYQHTAETMPPVEEHGALLAAAVTAPATFDPVLAGLLGSTSLEKRFYATLVLTKRSPERMLGPLRERIFDRDLQTRQLARSILLGARGHANFDRDVLEPLRCQLLHAEDEHQVESAVELLGLAHDRHSVATLIELLEQHKGRTQQAILLALQRITLQPLAAVAFSWRTWWKMGQREERREWLMRALNASAEPIRELAAQELQRLPGLSLNYHPRQPPAIRIRAQQQLKLWLEQHPEQASKL